MTGTIRSIRDEIKNAKVPAVGTLSQPFALLSGTSAGRIRSYVDTLQSGVALGAMQALKEASSTGATGFGAMNQKELGLLIADIGALDPDNTEPDIFLKTLDRLDARQKRVAADIRRNVTPERIAELGLEPILQAIEADDLPGTKEEMESLSDDEVLRRLGIR